MLSFFRRFFQSKIGLPIFIGFLVLVAFAFAAADITGSTFGGLSAGSRVAAVGREAISASELSSSANAALNQMRQQADPTLTMPEFVEEGGLDEVMQQLIDRYAVGLYARQYGLRAGKNLIDSEILKIPAFRGVTGEFDQEVYLAALRQSNITDAVLRRDLADGLLEQQLLKSALAAPQMPEKIARRYAALVLEKRRGEIALIPSNAFAPTAEPTNAQLETWYRDNRVRFTRPERRVIRFAVFDVAALGVDATPTQAEITARFKANADAYKASELRAVSYFIVPTEDAAKSFAERLRGGASLEAIARDAGFNIAKAELRDQQTLATSTSASFAGSAFNVSERGAVEPARGTLGWYVGRVDTVQRLPARSLAEVSAQIAEQLKVEKLAAATAEQVSRIEEEIDSGTALADVAKAYGLKIETTPQLLADGRVFGQANAQIVPELLPLLGTAFEMEESSPQLAELAPGEEYVIFDVARIDEARAAPLSEIRNEAIAGWQQAEGAKLAKAAADRVLAKMRNGKSLNEALADENKLGIEREAIDLRRRELMSQSGNVPPPLVLMFSMAKGSAKKLEAARNIGWYIVALDEISSDPIESEPGIVGQTRQQLAASLAREYRVQALASIREEIGVERNETAIASLRKQLRGEN